MENKKKESGFIRFIKRMVEWAKLNSFESESRAEAIKPSRACEAPVVEVVGEKESTTLEGKNRETAVKPFVVKLNEKLNRLNREIDMLDEYADNASDLIATSDNETSKEYYEVLRSKAQAKADKIVNMLSVTTEAARKTVLEIVVLDELKDCKKELDKKIAILNEMLDQHSAACAYVKPIRNIRTAVPESKVEDLIESLNEQIYGEVVPAVDNGDEPVRDNTEPSGTPLVVRLLKRKLNLERQHDGWVDLVEELKRAILTVSSKRLKTDVGTIKTNAEVQAKYLETILGVDYKEAFEVAVILATLESLRSTKKELNRKISKLKLVIKSNQYAYELVKRMKDKRASIDNEYLEAEMNTILMRL